MDSYFIYKLLEVILCATNAVVDLLFGYSLLLGTREERSSSKMYETSAQVVKVFFKHRESTTPGGGQYLFLHHEYRHPNFVLQDNVSLFRVANDVACFTVVPQQVDIYSSHTHPYLHCAQLDNSTHLVFMPHESLHRLAREIGDPKYQVVLLSNTGRCGSTLVTQCFETLPGTRTISEPLALLDALHLFNAGVTSLDEHRNLLQSIVRVQCKKVNEKLINRMTIKPLSKCTQLVHSISITCRFVRHVFMYRHPEQYVLSFASLYQTNPEFCSKIHAKLIPIPETGEYEWVKYKNFAERSSMYEILASYWSLICLCYLEYRKNGVVMMTLSYEQLVENPFKAVSSLFEFLDLPNELVPQALTAFNKDSHAGTERSQVNLRKYRASCLTQKQREEVNSVLLEYGFSTIADFELSLLCNN